MEKSDRYKSLSDRLLEILQHSSIVGSYIYNKDNGSILFVNDAFCRMLGYEHDHLINKNIDIFVADSDKQISDLEWLKNNANHKERRTIVYKAKNGNIKLCYSYSYPMEFEKENVRFVVVLDVTEEKIHEKLYRTLSDINQAIVRIEDEPALLDTVCETLSSNIAFDIVAYGRINKQTQLFEVLNAYGKEGIIESLKNLKISVDEFSEEGKGVVGRAYRTKKTAFVEDVYKEQGMEIFRGFFRENGISSVCALPILKNDKIAYIILIYSYTKNLFSDLYMKLLEEMRTDVCFVLEKFEKDAELKLFLKSFENSPAWVISTDEKGNITKVNKTVTNITGYKKEELIGKNPRIFKSGYHSEEFYKKMWKTILSGNIFKCQFVNKIKDGSLIYLDTIIMPITNNGKIYQYVNISRDMTKEIKQRQKIEKLSRMYKTISEIQNLLLKSDNENFILNKLPEIVLKDNDFSLTFVILKNNSGDFSIVSKATKNERILGFLDYINEQIKQKSKSLQSCIFAKTVKYGYLYIENNIMKKENMEDWQKEFEKYNLVSSFSVPIMKDNRVIGALVGISKHSDLFDKEMCGVLEKIQQIVSYSLEKLETQKWHNLFIRAMNVGFDGIIIMDKDLKIVYVSDSVIKHTGYAKEELIGAPYSIFVPSTYNREAKDNLYNKLKAGEAYSDIISYRNRNHELFNILVNIVPYKVNDKVEYYIGIGRDITKQRTLQETLNGILTHDNLTGLLNRDTFLKKVSDFLDMANNKDSMGVMYVINPLKLSEVNQAFGFETGDGVLIEMSKRINKYTREYDIVGKLESDKFAIFLKNLKREEDALVVIMNLIKKLSQAYYVKDKVINMFFNAGVSLYPSDDSTAEGLLEKAQIALVDAKSKGKNSVGFYRERFRQEAERKLKLKTEIQTALKNREFIIHYQPYFDAQTEKIKGAEALIRWKKDGKIIPPGEFIPYLEEIKMISEIEDWTTSYIPEKIKEWKNEGMNIVPISINISPDSFKNESFAETISSKTRGVEPYFINIEIVERLFLESNDKIKNVLYLLKNKGLSISMDDFGTGYSSLSYISNLPIDYIKIDISFTRKIMTNAVTRAVVKSIISLAKDIGMKTIAEGVETKEQLDLLKRMGCDYIQGFLLSKPLEEETFKKLLK